MTFRLMCIKLPVESPVLFAYLVVRVINLTQVDVELVLVQHLQQEALLAGQAQLGEFLGVLVELSIVHFVAEKGLLLHFLPKCLELLSGLRRLDLINVTGIPLH
ncbi:MAG: hypothetical protein V3S14_08030, partial [Anaerolineae bacterium]